MKRYFQYLTIVLCISGISIASASAQEPEKEYTVLIETNMGNMKARLYNDTPKHRDKFVQLAKAGHYDGTLFYRVIKDFMIQGGSADSRNASPGEELGYAPEILVDAEFNPRHYHKKGALAAPRQPDEANPRKRSDIAQFYVVQGRVYLPEEFKAMENKVNNPIKRKINSKYLTPEKEAILDSLKKLKKVEEFRAIADEIKQQIAEEMDNHPGVLRIPEEIKKDYTTVGGTYELDNEYTVFGEVFEGIEIMDKIAALKVDKNNRPETDVKIIRVKIIHP